MKNLLESFHVRKARKYLFLHMIQLEGDHEPFLVEVEDAADVDDLLKAIF